MTDVLPGLQKALNGDGPNGMMPFDPRATQAVKEVRRRAFAADAVQSQSDEDRICLESRRIVTAVGCSMTASCLPSR